MVPRCGDCEAELRAGARFCDQCGTPIGGAAPPPQQSPPDGPAPLVAQRKTITVVFGDVGGSTGLGERLDPEAAREVMNQYHRDVLELIEGHGGTVDKFNGDGFMATFGIPEVSEDDAANAVQAAVEIQERFAPFAAGVHERHGGEPITLRIGVNTGEIVIAEGDPDIIGDALNVAARLERACPSGGVLVGPETWRLTRGSWSYEPQGEVTVAGRVEPVEVFLVEKAMADVETATPFVGRDREVDLVRAQLEQAVDTHSLRLVNVIGSPGLGKSRLAREIVAGLDFDHRHTVSCERAGASTFAPVIDLVRSVAGVGPTASPEAIMAALRERFADVDFADREAERLNDAMSGLVGAGPIRSTEESFWSVRRLVELVGREGPTLIVVDDIQWAEPVVLDLLEHLAEWVTGADVVLLCLARPEIRDLRPSLTEAGRRADAVVALEGLDAEATAALAERMLGEGELPAALIERIPTSTEGNPLFVRELVKMLVDDGVVVKGASGWELTIDAEAVEVPPTIASLLAARIDRLPDIERIVLERAAVIGPEFVEGALQAIAGDQVASLAAVLERLRRMELVEPTGSYWGDHAVHRFHHVLIRDAAYRRLLKGARADLHEQVAAWLEAAAADLPGDHDEAIAFHEEQAFRYRSELGPLDEHSVEVGRRASARLAAAASRALARDDLTAAGPLAIRALDCIPTTDESRGELLLVACEALLGTGDVVRGEASVDELDAIAPDDRLRAWAACFRAQLTAMTEPDRLPESEQEATTAATVLEALRDDAGAAKGHLTRARILVLLGRVGEAESELDLALTAAREAEDARRITAVLGNAPFAALWGPSPVPRAGGRCLDIVRLLRITTRAPAVEASSMRCQALLEALRGRFDTARTMIDRCRRKVDELGLQLGSLETELFAGQIELLAGDLDAAEPPLRRAYTGLAVMRLGAEAGQAASSLARVLVAKGELAEADVLVGTAEQMAGRNLKTAAAWRVARAELLLARGDVDAAVDSATAAVEVVAGTDLVVDRADAHRTLARAHDAAGSAAEAHDHDRQARALAIEKGATALFDDDASKDHGPEDRPADSPGVPRPASSSSDDSTWIPDAATQVPSQHWNPDELRSRVWGARLLDLLHAGEMDTALLLVDEDFVGTDHRPGLSNVVDKRGFEHNHRYRWSARVEVALLAVRGDRVSMSWSLSSFDGSEVELVVVQVWSDAGCLRSNDTFARAQIDDAIDCMLERHRECCAEDGVEPVENAASEVGLRIRVHLNLGDLDGAAAITHPDVVFVEHEHHVEFGLEGVLRNRETTYGAGMSVRSYGKTLAVAGPNALCLSRIEIPNSDGSDDFTVAQYLVLTAHDDGRLLRSEAFPLDRHDEAWTCFESMSREPVGAVEGPWDPEPTTVVTGMRALVDAARSGAGVDDVELSDDFVWTDHRPTYAGRFGGEEALASVAPTHDFALRPILCGTDRVLLADLAATTNGFDTRWIGVIWYSPSGVGLTMDSYELDQLDDAVDRYHELVVEDAERFGVAVVANDASRQTDRVEAHISLGRVDGPERFYALDVVHHEHRKDIGDFVLRGRDGAVENVRVIASSGGSLAARTVRVAGDRLALRILSFTADGFRTDAVGLVELDDEGRIRFGEGWDLADWDEAVAEFERRAAALDRTNSLAIEPWDPKSTWIYRTIQLGAADISSGDLDRHRQRYADDFVYTDHRPGLLGTFDVDQQVESFRGADRVEPRAVLLPTDRVGLFLFDAETQGFSIMFLSVAHMGPDGLMRSFDAFEVEQLDVAIDRYHGVLVDDAERFGGGVAANEAARMFDRIAARLLLGDLDGIAALLPEDATHAEWRQTALGVAKFDGREAVLEAFRTMGRPDVMACRIERTAGEHLALEVCHFEVSGFPFDFAILCETAGDRVRSTTTWDLVDWDDAVAEFERLSAVDDAPTIDPWDPEATTVMRVRRRLQAVVATGDDVSAEPDALMAEDLVYVEHRPLFAGTFTREQSIAGYRGLERLVVEPVLCGTDRVDLTLATFEVGGNLVDILIVAAATPTGLIWRTENFEADQLDAAIDRYHELVREDADRFGGEVVENEASRSLDRCRAHLSLGNVDRALDLVAENYVEDDRRPVVGARVDGRDANRAQWESMAGGTFLSRTVRVAGERLAMTVVRSVAQDFTVDILSVNEIDEHGRQVRAGVYDLDQHDEAIAEFERRSTAAPAIEPWDPEATTAMRSFRLWERFTNDREHHRHPSLYSDDLVWVDHRPMFAGTFDADGKFRSLDPAQGADLRPILVTTDRIALALISIETNDFTTELLQIIRVAREGTAVEEHTFDLGQVDDAVDEYHRLVIEDAERFGGDVIANEASRLADRSSAHLSMGSIDRAAELISDDHEFIDRRPSDGGLTHTHGRAEWRPFVEAIFDGKTASYGPALRTIGDRLALLLIRVSTRDFFTDVIHLVEQDGDGRRRAVVFYDLDQYDEAVAEMERRAAVIGDTPTVDSWDPSCSPILVAMDAQRDAVHASDRVAHRALHAEDLVWTDHRPALAGEFTADDQVSSMQAVDRYTDTVLLVADRVCLTRSATETSGFSVDFLAVGVVGTDGLILSFDTYEPEQLDLAVDRYHEMLAEDAQRYGGEALVNDATRSAARLDAHGNLFGFEDVGRFFAQDVTLHDGRRLIGHHVSGREGVAQAFAKTFPSSAEPSVQHRVLRLAGDRVALRRDHVEARGFVTDYLVVVESDGGGAVSGYRLFDLDRYDEAVAELEGRAAEIEPSTIERFSRNFVRCILRKDRAGQRALCAADMVFIDHRPLFAGTYGPNELVDSTAPVEDMSFEMVRSDDDLSSLSHYTCVTQDFTIEVLNLGIVDPDGRMTRLETFHIDDLDAAVARYDEIVAERSTNGSD